MRLGGNARAGFFGLRRLAITLYQQVAFSMTETSFDELMQAEGLSFAECDALFSVNLLTRRAGRVSFSHEILLNACVAFDLARNGVHDPADLGQQLSTPILESISGDIIAAIDNAAVCKAVLAEVMSSSLLVGATKGDFGAIAASTALNLLNETTRACSDEIRSARLVLSREGDTVRIGWEDGTRRAWSLAEKARLQAVGRVAILGLGIDTYLQLCAEMDSRLASERKRWMEYARQEQYPIRSRSFALAYYGFFESIGFTQVARSTHCGFESVPRDKKDDSINWEELTSGQLHFFLEGRRVFFNGENDSFAEGLIYLFRERFRREPYHVQLVILNSVYLARQASQEVLDCLIEAINALEIDSRNWGISTSIVEALKILGGLDSDAEQARAQINAELASVLIDDGQAVDNDLALSLYVSMFDHPYDFIYCEAINELNDELRRRLYRRALLASNIKNSIGFDWLIKEVVSFEDPKDADLMRPFTNLPSRTHPFIQDEWGAFVSATRFIGRHRAGLEPISPTNPEESCVNEIRFLVYAIEAKLGTGAEKVKLAWQLLHQMNPQLVIGCLGEVQLALFERDDQINKVETYPPVDLVAAYSSDCLAISRRFVDDGADAQFYHLCPDKETGLSFAFNTIGVYGDRSDVGRLRDRSRGHAFAYYAIAALKRLESGFGSG